MEDALTPAQLQHLMHKIAKRSVKVIRYGDIIRQSDLGRLFGKDNAFIIYYPYAQTNEGTIGHYTCLVRVGNELHYYDPLGLKPDEYKRTTPYRNSLYRENQNSLIRHLLNKLNKGFHIDYSHHKHQSKNPEMATCGRHCVVRCMMDDMTNDEYNRTLKGIKRKFHVGSAVRSDRYMDHLIYELTREFV